MGNERTLSEDEKVNQLSKVPMGYRFITGKNMPTLLDLSLLPPETKITMCHLDQRAGPSGELEVFLNESADEWCNRWSMKTNVITLRQVKYEVHYPTKSGSAFTANVVALAKPVQGVSRKKYFPSFLTGAPKDVLTDVVDNVMVSNQPINYDAVLNSVLNDPTRYPVLAQHTIEFPRMFVSRNQVSFLGLPQGTKLFTANGGEFTVHQRANLNYDAQGKATGHLALIPDNPKAADVALAEGWGSTILNNMACVLVGGELMTSYSRNNFVMSKTKVPYKDTLNEWPTAGWFNRPVVQGVRVTVTGRNGKTMEFVVNVDDVGNDLDKFLFG